jgi:hypothetical protein
VLAAVSFAEPAWRLVKSLFDWGGRYDFVDARSGQVAAMWNLIINPPGWLPFITAAVGVALIWWDLLRRLVAPHQSVDSWRLAAYVATPIVVAIAMASILALGCTSLLAVAPSRQQRHPPNLAVQSPPRSLQRRSPPLHLPPRPPIGQVARANLSRWTSMR